jgi:hypothetical protein
MRFLILVGLTTSAITLLWFPRPVEPNDVPGLRLDAALVRAQLDADRKAAASVPGTAAARSFSDLLRTHLQASATGGELFEVAQRQSAARGNALRTLLRDSGPEALVAFRARTAEYAIPAITGQVEPDEMRARVGRLIDHLFQYGMAKGNHILAPSFVIRTAAKLRFNLAADRKPLEGFSNIELQAHYGWLALHADTLPPQERLVALERLERAAGKKLDEARAALLFDMGEEPKASALWARLADRTGNRRFRNLQAAALARLPAEP